MQERHDDVCSATEVLNRTSVLKARAKLFHVCADLLASTCNGRELLAALADILTHTACHIAEGDQTDGGKREESKTN